MVTPRHGRLRLGFVGLNLLLLLDNGRPLRCVAGAVENLHGAQRQALCEFEVASIARADG
jgi:hypothetical protein